MRTVRKTTEALLGAGAGTEVNIARTKGVVTSLSLSVSLSLSLSLEQYLNTDTGKATSGMGHGTVQEFQKDTNKSQYIKFGQCRLPFGPDSVLFPF